MPPSFSGLLAACSLASLGSAYPSFRYRVPNGDRVPCPDGALGCVPGDVSAGQPESACFGLGHNTCAGGTLPLNAWGAALEAAGHQWTLELCEGDADGDGWSNGEELGDPCCRWSAGDLPSEHMAAHTPSHPGDAGHTPASAARVDCNTASEAMAPAAEAQTVGEFGASEIAAGANYTAMFLLDGFELPRLQTIYANIYFNIPYLDESSVFHIVGGYAIVDQPLHLHHFTVHGCAEPINEEVQGQAFIEARGADNDREPTCHRENQLSGFAGWAPGSGLFGIPADTGIPIGRAAGVVAFRLNVHFTDANVPALPVTSRDGIAVRFTSALRPLTVRQNLLIALGGHDGIMVPPGQGRWFLTRTCTVRPLASSSGPCEDMSDRELMAAADGLTCEAGVELGYCDVSQDMRDACPVSCGVCVPTTSEGSEPAIAEWPVIAAFHHAHLLGAEMYITRARRNRETNVSETIEFGSMPIWHFDDQAQVDMQTSAFTVREGDVLQSSCVFNSTARQDPTIFGRSTYDEMCFNMLMTTHNASTMTAQAGFSCSPGDNLWAGLLAEGEDARLVATSHPIANATDIWEMNGPEPDRWIGRYSFDVLLPLAQAIVEAFDIQVAPPPWQRLDDSACTSWGNDCCASMEWEEPQTCLDGYEVIDISAERGDCWYSCRLLAPPSTTAAVAADDTNNTNDTEVTTRQLQEANNSTNATFDGFLDYREMSIAWREIPSSMRHEEFSMSAFDAICTSVGGRAAVNFALSAEDLALWASAPVDPDARVELSEEEAGHRMRECLEISHTIAEACCGSRRLQQPSCEECAQDFRANDGCQPFLRNACEEGSCDDAVPAGCADRAECLDTVAQACLGEFGVDEWWGGVEEEAIYFFGSDDQYPGCDTQFAGNVESEEECRYAARMSDSSSPSREEWPEGPKGCHRQVSGNSGNFQWNAPGIGQHASDEHFPVCRTFGRPWSIGGEPAGDREDFERQWQGEEWSGELCDVCEDPSSFHSDRTIPGEDYSCAEAQHYMYNEIRDRPSEESGRSSDLIPLLYFAAVGRTALNAHAASQTDASVDCANQQPPWVYEIDASARSCIRGMNNCAEEWADGGCEAVARGESKLFADDCYHCANDDELQPRLSELCHWGVSREAAATETVWLARAGKCYALRTLSEDTHEPEGICRSMLGATLPIIRSEAENAFVWELYRSIATAASAGAAGLNLMGIEAFRETRGAIGLEKQFGSENWLWMDGSEATYENWGGEQPRDEGSAARMRMGEDCDGCWEVRDRRDSWGMDVLACEVPQGAAVSAFQRLTEMAAQVIELFDTDGDSMASHEEVSAMMDMTLIDFLNIVRGMDPAGVNTSRTVMSPGAMARFALEYESGLQFLGSLAAGIMWERARAMVVEEFHLQQGECEEGFLQYDRSCYAVRSNNNDGQLRQCCMTCLDASIDCIDLSSVCGPGAHFPRPRSEEEHGMIFELAIPQEAFVGLMMEAFPALRPQEMQEYLEEWLGSRRILLDGVPSRSSGYTWADGSEIAWWPGARVTPWSESLLGAGPEGWYSVEMDSLDDIGFYVCQVDLPTTTTTTTVTFAAGVEVETVVTGELGLTVENPLAFVLDPTSKPAVEATLSSMLSVPRGNIDATLTADRRLLVASSRRLEGGVTVDYAITVADEDAAQDLLSAMVQADRAEMTATLSTQLQSEGSTMVVLSMAPIVAPTVQRQAASPQNRQQENDHTSSSVASKGDFALRRLLVLVGLGFSVVAYLAV